MLLRLGLVTLFLSGTLLINTAALSELNEPRGRAALGLIVSTYALTIGYAVWLRRRGISHRFVYLQLALDVVISATLIAATGELRSSIFLFTLFLPIIAAAVVLGRAASLTLASAVAVAMLGLGLITIGILPNPIVPNMQPTKLTAAFAQTVLFEATVNIVTAYVLAWVSGQLSRQLGQAHQELERQQVDLRELKALHENILASLNSGLMTTDLSGHIVYFNEAASQITGCTSAQILGQHAQTILTDLAHALTPQARAIDQEARFEGLYEHPSGESIPLGFSRAALRDSSGVHIGWIVIFQDLTQIKALEQQAKRSERLAAIGQLSAAIAHEIRNPLASISGSVEMLQLLGAPGEDEAMLMGIVMREVERLNALISQFLDYSRPRPLQLQAVSLGPLIDEVLTLFAHRPEAPPVRRELDPDARDVLASVDVEAIRQVLWNLLNNAAEAMRDYGQQNPDDARQPELLISLQGQAQTLRLSVEDSGPGVPEAVQPHIFEPFFTTKRQGTGLGLATIYRLIEDHQGQIALTVAEQLGGARFEVTLPRAPSTTQEHDA